MPLPLRRAKHPKHNPPIWAATSTSGILGLVAAMQADDIPVPVQVAVVLGSMVLGFVGGLIAQNSTVPTAPPEQGD